MVTLAAAVAVLALPSPASAHERTSRAPSRRAEASPRSRALARLEAGAAQTRHEVLSRLRPGTGACAGLLQSRFAGAHGQRCLHGLDTWTPDASGHPGVSSATRATALPQFDDLPGIPCYSSGPRVHVFYGYFEKNLLDATGDQGRRGAILHAVAVADRILNVSADQTGGVRHLRWAMSNCRLVITPFRVAQKWTFEAFDPTYLRIKLEQAHLMGKSEKGLTFLETATSPIPAGCQGVGELYDDDRASSTNIHNHGDFNTLVVTGCADALFDPFAMGEIAIHELFHTMGAVQLSAPNHTPGHHCTDESDVMCYNDDGHHAMRKVCPVTVPELLDCNDNDYFNTSPKAGSYLATHWDTARNVFQATGGPSKFQPLPKPKVALKSPGAVIDGTVTIPASAQAALAPIGSVTFTVDGRKTVDYVAPYSITIQTLPEKGGYPNGTKLTIGAVAEDRFGIRGTAKSITVTVNNPTIQLVAPHWFDTVGKHVSWSATVHAAKPIKNVQLFVNGVLAATDTSSPFGGMANVQFPGSQFPIMAKVTQTDGVSRTSEPKTLVSNDPRATAVFPSSNLQLDIEGPVTLFAVADAWPGLEIDHVTFRLLHAGQPIPNVDPIVVNDAPYVVTWNPPNGFSGGVGVRVTATDTGGMTELAPFNELRFNVLHGVDDAVEIDTSTLQDPVDGRVTVRANPQPGPGRHADHVTFFVDDVWAGEADSAPWELSDFGDDPGWDSLSVGNGTHVISAIADFSNDDTFDDIESVGAGGTPIVVANPPGLLATVTSPDGGDHVSGSVSVTATVTKPAGQQVTAVEFFANGLSLGTDSTPGDGFHRTWNTSQFGNGPVQVRVHAYLDPYGSAGNAAWSRPVTVTVSNAS